MNNCIKKRLLLLPVIMCSWSSLAFGQFEQGAKTAGGGIGFRSVNQENPNSWSRQPDGSYSQFTSRMRSRSFFLNLGGGYLLEENLEVGGNLGLSSSYSITESEYFNDSESSSTVFSLGPYVRVYNPVTDVVGLFAQAGFTAGLGGGSADDTATRLRTFEAGVSPGIILMVNENLGLETTIGFVGYNYYASGPKEDFADRRTVSSNFDLRFDLSAIRFGFRLYLTD